MNVILGRCHFGPKHRDLGRNSPEIEGEFSANFLEAFASKSLPSPLQVCDRLGQRLNKVSHDSVFAPPDVEYTNGGRGSRGCREFENQAALLPNEPGDYMLFVMNHHRFPTVCVLIVCIAGLSGCAQTALSRSSGADYGSQDIRRPDSGARLMESAAHQQRQVDANSRVGEHTK